ncbi:hypothetical protein AAAC51_17305 [Priestia megaterium]
MKPKITASYSGGAISVNWSASNAASDTTFTVTMSSPNGSEQLASGAGAGGKQFPAQHQAQRIVSP